MKTKLEILLEKIESDSDEMISKLSPEIAKNLVLFGAVTDENGNRACSGNRVCYNNNRCSGNYMCSSNSRCHER